MPMTELAPDATIEESEEVSSLFEPEDDGVTSITDQKTHLEKHDEQTWEELKTKFNPERDHRNKHQKGNNDGERLEGKGMVAEWKKRNEKIFSDREEKDALGSEGKEEPLPVSEQLWEDEDLKDNEPNWEEFLREYGKTPVDGDEKEFVISIVTPRDIETARREKYFGRGSRRV